MRTFTVAASLAFLAGFVAPPVGADDPAPAPAAPAPVPNTDETQANVLKWIADLGSEDFRTREAAQKKLQEAGPAAREALEAAAKTSDSLEVRWRAQQILMRLGGKDERALDAPGAVEPAPEAGAVRDLLDAETPEAFRQFMERFMRDFPRAGRLGPSPWPLGPMPDTIASFGNILKAGDLTLFLPVFGSDEYRLIVQGKGHAAVPQTFTGASLDAIVAAHPELKDTAGLEDLRKQVAERKKRGDGGTQGFSFRGAPGGSFTFRMSSDGIEMRQDANGAVIRVQERDADGKPVLGEDGKPVVKEYRGASFDEIKAKNPELAKRLGTFGEFQFGFGPPRIFRGGQQEQGLAPMPPAPPEVPVPGPAVRFGVRLGAMEDVLALHLGLESGRGVIVTDVTPGSQAEKIGLQRYDVIESIDGQPVTGFKTAVEALRAKAQDAKGGLTLAIIRTGQRQTLVR